MNLLEQIFFKEESLYQKKYEKFFNRSFGFNYEFMGFYLEKERKAHDISKILVKKQLEEITELNSKINKLEKVLIYFTLEYV